MNDCLHRFVFEHQPVRGSLASLDASWHAVLERRSYPPVIRAVLGEAMAAAVLLAATIKFDGLMTLQIQSQGVLRLLVVQITAQRTVRGLARWEGVPQAGSLAELCAHGQLALTIDPGRGRETYQGVVALDGATLAEALEAYFARSEQLPTRLVLAADGQRAAGLLVQRLPGEAEDADAWNRVEQLTATLSAAELLGLRADTVIRRLFHEEDLRVFEPDPIAFRCTCSRERAGGMLQALGPDELREILAEQGEVTVDCEFCGQRYAFDAVDTAGLLTPGTQAGVSGTRH